jgi:LPS sulfotransferase NodH
MRVSSPIWDFYLNEAPDTKVIYMNRDFLESCASFYAAVETKVWHAYNPKFSERNDSIYLPPGYMVGYYHRFCSFEQSYRRRLSGLKSMDVHYQDIQANPNDVLLKVQEFLGIEPRELKWFTYKLNSKPIQARIKNYDELMNVVGDMSPLEYSQRNMI